jgi:hypothetical protein
VGYPVGEPQYTTSLHPVGVKTITSNEKKIMNQFLPITLLVKASRRLYSLLEKSRKMHNNEDDKKSRKKQK